MKLMSAFILALTLTTVAFAQTNEKENNIFLELFGNAGAYSLNYDRVVYPNVSVRAGLMMLSSDSQLITGIPLLGNYRFYIGKDYIETGLGATIFSASLDFGTLGNKDATGTIPTGVIAYCFQSDGAINFRIAYTPFYYNQKFISFGGFSLGYRF